MAKSVLITGGNRGIGREFVEHYAKQGDKVYVVLRNPNAPAIQELVNQYKNIEIIELELTDFNDYSKLETYFKDRPIDVLINNAGISGERNQTIGHFSPENFENVIKINTIAPVMMIQTLYPALQKGEDKVIVNITSRMGSIADNDSGKSYAYRSSKAALNCVMRSLQIDVAKDGFKVLLLHPGWVKTDMGGENALLDTKTSVQHMCKLIDSAHELPDLFYHCEGQPLPW